MPVKGKGLIDARIDEIRVLLENGATMPELVEATGFSQPGLRKAVERHGLPKPIDKYHKGFITTHNGYKMIQVPGHPGADSKGYVRVHRLIMEAHLDRYLEAGEVVHHKDHDKFNNRIENLELTTLSEHTGHHARNGDCGWNAYHEKRS